MNLAMLLMAAAVCAAPWSTPAADRLAGLTPPATARVGAARPRGVLADLHRRLPRRGGGPADQGTLAQVLDLLAAALLTGLSAADAVSAVADAVEHHAPEVARPLRAAASRIRLGATPAEAWREVPGRAEIEPVAAVLARATDGGGSTRAALEHSATRMRTGADAAATARAERAAVLVAGPLGLCFLPAFICLGVLPVVVGLAGDMLPGLGP